MEKTKQPIGLYICALTELWERFGFYSVQAILVLYLVHQMNFSDEHAYSTYAALTSLLYAGPVIGGIIADKFLNFSHAIIFGIVLFAIGYFLLTINSEYSFYLAFAALIGGNGYLKGNLSALVGTLYDQNDLRRDSGFTLFYCGSNIGQVLGPIITALAIKFYGYNAAFFSAGVSLLISLLVFSIGKKYVLKATDNICAPIKNTYKNNILVYILTIIGLLIFSPILPRSHIIEIFIIAFSIFSILYLIYCAISLELPADRYRLFFLTVLFVFSSIYWAMWMQIFTTMTLFIDRNVDRVILGWDIPASIFPSFESFAVVILAPLLAKLWMNLGKSHLQPSFGLKFSFAFFFTGLSFYTLVFAINHFNFNGVISIYWVILGLFLLAAGELCLSAIGLSAVSVLSPKKIAGTMMGFWFLTIAAGLVISERLSDFASVKRGINLSESLIIYQHAFHKYMQISFGIASVMVLLSIAFKGFLRSDKIQGDS